MFESHTRAIQKGIYRFLIMDGHGSHILKEFIQFCENHSIIALYFSPYITYILQPLNISVFASLIKIYKKRMYDYNIYNIDNIDKFIFLEFLYEARKKIIFDHDIINIF
jgi:hypothetical protein